MQHFVYSSCDSYPIAVLVKDSAFGKREIESAYVTYLEKHGVSRNDIIFVALPYNGNKLTATFIKQQLDTLMPALAAVSVETIFCTDAAYFKALSKTKKKANEELGYVLPCKLKDYEHLDVIYGINHKQLLYNPNSEGALLLSLDTLHKVRNGTYEGIGNSIIHNAQYPTSLAAIESALEKLHQHDMLSCDIEAYSLDFDKAGIATITFCWSQNEGIAFPVDMADDMEAIRALLKTFFETYNGHLIWHNAAYDLKVIIYTLWMKSLLDTEGLLTGLEIMTARFHDTKLIAYLALNSCARPELGLKVLAHPFAGAYALDVKDITQHSVNDVLKYNLIDGLSTWYVFDTYFPRMVTDQQQDLYEHLYLPSQQTLIQIEMTGMPLNAKRVQEVKAELKQAAMNEHLAIMQSPLVHKTNTILRNTAHAKDFNNRKKKAKNPDKIQPKCISKFAHIILNPGSSDNLRVLLYEVLELPVLATTDTGLPSTKAKELEKLINHTSDQATIDLINNLIGYSNAQKILSTFIPAFEKALNKGQDNIVWLHGSFNLGGPVSGRLSSSEPNLQNLPSGSTYGKLIKSCFEAPKGELFVGADFNALEERIGALTTKDPNRLTVYEHNYESHSLRAKTYWPERIPDIALPDTGKAYKVTLKDGSILYFHENDSEIQELI